jgi:hypothetical protein
MAAARPNWAIRPCWNGPAATSAASTRSARRKPFKHRPALDIATFGTEPCEFLQANGFIPPDLKAAYASIAQQALDGVRRCYDRAGELPQLRLHGDCHGGNVLWTDAGPHFVDFDDARMGPAIQDLWMMLSGERASRCARWATSWPATKTLAIQPAPDAPGGSAAHAAPDPLFGLAGAALGRSGLPGGFPVV